jgi:hypothetical protein
MGIACFLVKTSLAIPILFFLTFGRRKGEGKENFDRVHQEPIKYSFLFRFSLFNEERNREGIMF